MGKEAKISSILNVSKAGAVLLSRIRPLSYSNLEKSFAWQAKKNGPLSGVVNNHEESIKGSFQYKFNGTKKRTRLLVFPRDACFIGGVKMAC